MKPYQNKGGDSGITAYEIADDWIDIAWGTNVYRYHLSKIGPGHLSELKQLAEAGNDLNTYINQHQDVKKSAERIR